MSPELFDYLILPFLIFLARIVDVSIGTLRIIFVSKGKKYLAPLLGFFEVLVWIIAIGEIMQNLNNISCYIGYALGFAAGNYIGMLIEEKLALGVVGIRIVTKRNADNLIQALIEGGYGITHLDAHGAKEDVSVIYSSIMRQDLNQMVDLIKHHNPKAFYTVEDIKFVKEGFFKPTLPHRSNSFAVFNSLRKRK
jgi:uncharacterized protein YebE (UPF0316 family)